MIHPLFYFLLFTLCGGALTAQNARWYEQQEEQRWVDSVMQTLSTRQRIAQLFIAPIELTHNRQPQLERLVRLLQKEALGGLIVMKAQPDAYVPAMNRLQAAARVPLLVSMDAEWGVAMRTDSSLAFPRQMMLGAVGDNDLIRRMGEAVGEQCRAMGIHMNYAPVVDVNNNPLNPVIHTRSFGDNIYNVAEKSAAYMQGLHNKGVLACIKHFPGHGDTQQDSHLTLPSIDHSAARMDSIELFPFRALMERGVDAIMVGHLQAPAFDTLQRPATLSRAVVGALLRDELEFAGLVVTDALNMKAVTKGRRADSLALAAFGAGNDVMLMPDSIAASIDVVERAVADGSLSAHRINMKCRKVLAAKYRAGLNRYRPLDESRPLWPRLNAPDDEALRYRLTEQALTVLRNRDDCLPLRRLDTMRIACLSIGAPATDAPFRRHLQYYAAVDTFAVPAAVTPDSLLRLRQRLAEYSLVIVGYFPNETRTRRHFGVDSLTARWVAELATEKPVVLTFFGTPYGIGAMGDVRSLAAIVVAYENTRYSQERAAQLIFGGVEAQGTLPVTVDSLWVFGNGLRSGPPTRLRYVVPEEIGIARAQLSGIDSLVRQAIEQQALPGAQMMAIRNGAVFYHKTFGRHTYDPASPVVAETDVYDWASITKVGATLPVVMQLTGDGRLSTDSTLGACLPELAGTNKASLKIADLLTHTSGLQAFQPFHKLLFPAIAANDTLRSDSRFFAHRADSAHPLPVAEGLYVSEEFPAYLYRLIDHSSLLRKTYRYSDWGFLYLQRAVERATGRPLDRLADSLFYSPLGMNFTGFRPLQRIAPGRIPPTENDTVFRCQRVQGTVHDPTAALLGGVAGHAGVFGNANDLAKLLQLYLQGGVYGGARYLTDSVVQLFTSCPLCDRGVRRGFGFDKPEPRPNRPGPVGREWSLESYGHSGYTGNLCWVDPARELIVIFLSNRSFPNDDKKLNRLNTRGLIFSKFAALVPEGVKN
jgi:beta-glucosidase-like glycosyl hydrolase/CubicO group peptidase (beta-lactamase class C family)